MTTSTAAIKAAMSVARDLAEGRLAVAQLDAEVVARCGELAFTVAGPDDPLWPDQVQVCRDVLALLGIPPDELAEWLAVTRQAAGVVEVVEPSWIEQALAQMGEDEDDGPVSEPRFSDERL